jgi:hypothetical protein
LYEERILRVVFAVMEATFLKNVLFKRFKKNYSAVYVNIGLLRRSGRAVPISLFDSSQNPTDYITIGGLPP